eukprot:2501570-Pyramimonas_sp.AAC.1
MEEDEEDQMRRREPEGEEDGRLGKDKRNSEEDDRRTRGTCGEEEGAATSGKEGAMRARHGE